MRAEDETAIKRGLAILKVECQKHKSCNSCMFYTKDRSVDAALCILDKPPMHYDIDKILECFT